ncbi:hypothetical protein TSUD_108390 [Trifolium subterraneum]|nr:hypothetical protein TSUD_108390 [Trifolium subterraneum]
MVRESVELSVGRRVDDNIKIEVNINGSWKWQLDSFEGYSAKGVYQLLTKEGQGVMPEQNEVAAKSGS